MTMEGTMGGAPCRREGDFDLVSQIGRRGTPQATPGQAMGDSQGELGVGDSPAAPSGGSRWGMCRGDDGHCWRDDGELSLGGASGATGGTPLGGARGLGDPLSSTGGLGYPLGDSIDEVSADSERIIGGIMGEAMTMEGTMGGAPCRREGDFDLVSQIGRRGTPQATPGQAMGDSQGELGVGDSPAAPSGGSRWGMCRGDGTFGTFGVTSGMGKETLCNPCKIAGGAQGVGELQGGVSRETDYTCHELGSAPGGLPSVIQASFREASDGNIAQGAELLALGGGGDLDALDDAGGGPGHLSNS
ncbi:unnamed protein product [Ilex paraguariensis]|uniref:Uncharacterized protein n=1 Tax=Ilex paraguariensis TaxID=185542 RepID=A0ABC8QRK7_9AQUA